MLRAALVVVLVGFTVPARGQTPPAPVFPATLEEVYVTVTVRDPSGRLVSDLRAEDFKVLEDGRPQKVDLFGRAVEAGHSQKVDLFGRAVEPGQEDAMALNLGLLMDTSESMLKELKLSQQAAVRFLEAIPRARELYTIFFDEDIRLSRYDSENQQGLFERIHALKGGGNTALYDAVSVYLSRVQDTGGRKVLVLFTDGEDSKSALSLHELTQLLRSSPVTIYAIAFTGGFPSGSSRALRARAVLDQLAEMTGGQVFTPRTFRDLEGIYNKILSELRAQYVLGYTPSGARRDGKLRKLKVEVAREGLKVRHRTGYFAPEG